MSFILDVSRFTLISSPVGENVRVPCLHCCFQFLFTCVITVEDFWRCVWLLFDLNGMISCTGINIKATWTGSLCMRNPTICCNVGIKCLPFLFLWVFFFLPTKELCTAWHRYQEAKYGYLFRQSWRQFIEWPLGTGFKIKSISIDSSMLKCYIWSVMVDLNILVVCVICTGLLRFWMGWCHPLPKFIVC